jgi:transcriptional regulator with XRE-family HTH domain
MTRVAIQPEMFRWARDRARLDNFALMARFPRLEAWEAGETQPTLRQLEDYAKATHAPVGYFFLPEPPVEPLPIPDFRTVANHAITRPSPNLLDMVYACQQRQDWYRDHAQVTGQSPLPFVGSLALAASTTDAAAQLRQALGFSVHCAGSSSRPTRSA